MDQIDDIIRIMDERAILQKERLKLSKQQIEYENDKYLFLKEKKQVFEENQIMSKENEELFKENKEYEEKLNICKICFVRRKISIGCCSGGMCMECWDVQENKNPRCPFCREEMPRLVDVLIRKLNKIHKYIGD